ncbi:MAG: DUF362 domain-containing protein [Candidatus Omnitrophica bacterium]|nr:DUF362 domain-containing protein [Candidatus Omnitrophota bacterium]
MKSRVYFIKVSEADSISAVQDKLLRLLNKSNLFAFIKPFDSVAVKLHFGEEGNTGFVRPEYLKVICAKVKEKAALPFLSDTNTLYKGSRTNSKDHLKLAYKHGFTPANVGAEVVIPDERDKAQIREVSLNQKFVKNAQVLSVYLEAQALVGVAHFKGHIMTGFGGALKNIGMGSATRQGKLEQHSNIAPIVYADNCVGCAACVEVCPVKAISMKDKKSCIDNAKCIGCATCIAVCNYRAIDVCWDSGGDLIQEKMVEYAKAILESKKKKSAFLNFCIKVTQECDCLAQDDPRIVPDIGIFASLDPVSLDKACLDMVNKAAGKDIFRELHPRRDGAKQLEHAASLGLGSLEYELLVV